MPDVEVHTHPYVHHVMEFWGKLLAGLGILLSGLAVLLWVLFVLFATVKATPFDSDGVRCYVKAEAMSCIKTAEPAR